jgi:hypothetical protein
VEAADPGQNGRVTATRRAERLLTPRRVVSSLLLAVAAAGIYMAFILHDDTPNPKLRPSAVRTVSPEPASLQLRQTEIFVELQPTYRGALSVNGITIPDDQLAVIDGLNRYSFTPGEGREIDELPPGRTCAEVTFSLVTDPDGEPGRYRWCFNVS